MSFITNQAINSRSMNGILTITDGTAILQDGKLDCDNVNVKTATITSLKDSDLVNCSTSTTPSSDNSIVNKKYVVDNFVDRTNNLTQNVNGLKTFQNNTNFTGSLLSRTNIKLSEYENTASTNTITLTFPMSETIALRTTPATANPMTINLPLLTNNERGYVFTFNKLFDTALNRNFPVTFNTSGGQAIYPLINQSGTPTTNTTLLSVEKIQCKLAVGWFGSLLYWIEQTDFSTYDRYKLTEWGNATTTNTLTLTLPLPPTIALRTSTESTMTINLPTLTTLERGQIFTFVKLNTYNYDVIFNTSSGQWIFPLNNISGGPTSNTTIFPSNKKLTKLAVGWFGNFTYWVEVSDYSTFDVEQNNLIYARLASPNTFTNTNTFNSLLISNNITAPSSTIAGENNIYTNLIASGTIKIGNLLSTNVVEGDTTFSSDITTPNIFCNDALYLNDYQPLPSPITYSSILVQNSDILNFDANFNNNKFQFKVSSNAVLLLDSTNTTIYNNLVSNNITSPSVTGTNNIYTNLSLDGGIVNIGAKGSNINIKCNLNIVESVYGNITKITTINQEGNSCRFTNNGSTNGNFIFTINEGSTYNTLVINKTSVDVAGDALIDGNLILYDTTPSSTKNVIIGMVGNDLFFTPYSNVPSSTYNFKVSDSASTITTPLIINSTNTTIANRLHLNAGSRYYSGLSYTEVLQTGAQLTIKPVHDSGTIALFSTNTSGTQTQQLLIDNTGISSPRIAGTNIFSTNYNSSTGFMTIGASTETGTISLGTNLTLGNVNIGNTTAGSFKINIRGSLFSTGQATFQNFCPKSETNPSVANDLVKLSYLQNNFCDLSTTQTIGGQKTFTGNTIIGSALYFTDLDDTSSLDIPNINNYDKTLYFLANNNYDNRFEFWCALNPQLSISQYSTEIKNPLIANEDATFSKDIKHRETQIINKVKTISTTSPAAFQFPLEQTWMFTSTGSTQINVTLPELSLSTQAGFNFSFFKTASVTNSVLFTCQGTNKIRGLNSITDLTSDTRISGTGTTGGFYTAEVSTGNFAWISY